MRQGLCGTISKALESRCQRDTGGGGLGWCPGGPPFWRGPWREGFLAPLVFADTYACSVISEIGRALCPHQSRDWNNSFASNHGVDLRLTINSLTVPTGMMSDVSLDRLSDCILRSSSSSLKRYGASFTGHHLQWNVQ